MRVPQMILSHHSDVEAQACSAAIAHLRGVREKPDAEHQEQHEVHIEDDVEDAPSAATASAQRAGRKVRISAMRAVTRLMSVAIIGTAKSAA